MDDLRGIQQDVQNIKSTLASLEQRLARLEGAPKPIQSIPAAATTAKPAVVPAGTMAKKPNNYTGTRIGLAIFGIIILYLGAVSWIFAIVGLGLLLLAIFWPSPKHVATATPAVGATVASSTPVVHQPRRPSQFEQDLAKHWFSWLGIISIVVGITLLLNYAFQGYGPIGRVFTGYGAALMLFGLWAWARKRYRGFGFILQSGAWAITYISTFALHVISGQPVDSPVVAGVLLFLVTTAMCAAALIQRSTTLTAGAFFLGYVTAFTNTLSTFVTVALLFLAIGAVVVASLKRWPALVTIATFATYFVQFGWLVSSRIDAHAGANFHATILFFDLLVFGAAHWLIGARNKYETQLTILGSAVNLSGFYFLFQYYVSLIDNPHGWIAPMLIGIVCGLLAGATKFLPSRQYLRAVYIVFSISFITVAFGQWLKGDTRTLVWLIESGAVLSLGILTRIRTMRIMGYLNTLVAVMSLLTVLLLHHEHFGTTTLDRRLVLGLLAMVIYAAVAFIARTKRGLLGPAERFLPEVAADLALVLGLTVVGQQAPEAWVPALWILVTPAALMYGARRKTLHGRAIGLLVAVMSLWYWLIIVSPAKDMAGAINIHARLLTGLWLSAVCGVVAWLHRNRPGAEQVERWLSTIFGWLTVVTLAITFGVEVANRWLSAAWGLEGVALYAIGFLGQNTTARRQGLVVLTITIAKVYIFDVQTLATPYRILSFILLGVILLGIGYAYNRWRQRPKQTT